MDKIFSRLKLKYLMITVIIFTFLLAIASSLYSTYYKNLELLKAQSLETNRVYAQKLSQVVDMYLTDAMSVLQYSAHRIENHVDDELYIKGELNRIYESTSFFNSVTISNPSTMIVGAAPESLHLKGVQIKSDEGLKAIKNQKPYISKPYEAATGRMLISLSYPLFSKEQKFQGLLTATIYLHESNFFNKVLGEHYYSNGSYVYVVDADGLIIYHQDQKRIGDNVMHNDVVKSLMTSDSGAQEVTNTKGIQMLAGYSTTTATNWGVVAQTPLEAAVRPLSKLVKDTFYEELPFFVIAIVIAIFATSVITKPLYRLSVIAESSTQESKLEQLAQLNGWYYEVLQIKNALISSFAFLHKKVNILTDQSMLDPLTNIMNRRTMDEVLGKWVSEEQAFSIIMLDLDRFKQVNDTYGHAVGDEVLKFLARHMEHVAREQDICCRFGGEEFVMLLPNTSLQEAYIIAEKLRRIMESIDSPCGRPVTLSAGVAIFPQHATSPNGLIEVVDQALYQAKNTGRNRVVKYSV